MTAEHIVVFLLMLSILVVLHEYGHFLVARRCGVRVTDFAVGLGPTLLKWTSPRSGTNYRLNLLPIGGYCADEGRGRQVDRGRAAARVPDRRRLRARQLPGQDAAGSGWRSSWPGRWRTSSSRLVLLVGSALAFGIPGDRAADHHDDLSALAGLSGRASAGMHPATGSSRSTAGDAGRQRQLVDTITAIARQAAAVVYQREGRDYRVTRRRSSDTPDGKQVGHLGFQPLPAMQRVGIAEAWQYSWAQFTNVIGRTLGVLGSLVTPLAAMISISLGIFNLLPIPALDGGRGVFILVEMLRGRPVDPEKEALVHVGGFAVLIVADAGRLVSRRRGGDRGPVPRF
jgi:regulator of sigma E protease